MQVYWDLVRHVLEHGKSKDDRTGDGTISVFGTMFRHSMADGFPLLTRRKMFLRGIIEELLFFLRADTNASKLGAKGVHIWRGNTTREFLDKRGLHAYPDGEIGPTYGWNWRNWNGMYEAEFEDGHRVLRKARDGFDQLAWAVNEIKTNPNSRRLLVSAWNADKVKDACLPPCHFAYQFNVHDGKLDLMFCMRSIDVALGLPYNTASYATLLMIVAKCCDLEPGELFFSGGDTHIYQHHVSSMQELLQRESFPLPTLIIDRDVRTLDDAEQLAFSDFMLLDYQCHPAVKMRMSI